MDRIAHARRCRTHSLSIPTGGIPAPGFATPPTIGTDGTPQIGETLTGNDGTISGGSVSARQWLLNGLAISGATGATYVPTATGNHAYRVTATGPGGTTQATSGAVNVVEASPLPTKVLAEGDSITATTSPRSYARLWGDKHPAVTFANYAVGGSGIAGMVSRRDTALAYEPSHLTVFIGANDLGSDVAAYRDSLYSYLAPFKTLGSTIILCTVLPRNLSGWNTKRHAFNALLRADAGDEFDYLVDFDNTPLGVDGAEFDSALFPDELHPSALGHSLLLREYEPTLNYSLGIANEPLNLDFDAVTDAEASTATTSAIYTVTGLYPGEKRPVSISGGTYSKNGGAFTASAGTVQNGDEVRVRVTSSGDPSGQVNATLTIGTTEAEFSVITAGAGGELWTPAELGARLAAWYQPSGIAEADGVHAETWSDSSGNANHAPARGVGKGPTVRAGTLNGYKTVEFIGPNQEWMLPPAAILTGRTATATFFVNRITTSPPATYLNGPVAGWGTNVGDYYPFSNNGVYSWYGRSSRIGPVNTPMVLTAWHVGMFLSAPSDWQFRLNGNAIHTTASNTVAMGTEPLIGKSWNGMLAEVVDVSGALTVLERQKIEGYLAHKYGLQAGLDAAHPFKSEAPTT